MHSKFVIASCFGRNPCLIMHLDWFLWDNEALRHLYKVLSLCDTLEIPFESSQGAQGRTLVGPLSKAVSKDG